jgi:xanthine dehydrogenase small subunit
MPIANAEGKHIVTIEGINMEHLSPVQKAMADTNGTQCGFCTPGFIMSFTGFLLNETSKTYEQAIASIDGNICRCTGYKSIERAAGLITHASTDKPGKNTISWLAENGFIPSYFINIKERLQEFQQSPGEKNNNAEKKLLIGGGTDLIVQRSLTVKRSIVEPTTENKDLKTIFINGEQCMIGGSVTVSEFAEHKSLQKIFPRLPQYMKLVSSTPIRNMATLAGNLVNASPIGDMTVFFLGLNADIILKTKESSRQIKLKDFYKGYKLLDKKEDEFISHIIFNNPGDNVFNFEKVSKRTHLDIASVNTACSLKFDPKGIIERIDLSAGGVSPIPKYLSNASGFLRGKTLSAENITEALNIINDEISPISDARGTAAYKRLLLRQLILTHFMTITGNTEMIRKIITV